MRRARKAAAVGLTLSIACLGFGNAAAADAHIRVVTGNDRTIPISEIDSSRDITLLVQKLPANPHDEVKVGDKPDGGVSGLTFTLHRAIGFDVTTAEGRADAARARSQAEFDALETVEGASRVTNAQGEAKFTGLKPGLYRLEESAPDDQHDYRLSSPRWLVLPFGDIMGTTFTYENVVVVKEGSPESPGSPSTPPESPPTAPGSSGRPPQTPPGPPPTAGNQPTPPPGTTDGAPADEANPEGSRETSLASTGANVLFAVAAGLLLIILGFGMSRRRDDGS